MKSKKDSIIVLAWPETNVIQVNMWYDRITRWLGYNKNEYYKAGHSAAILIENKTGKAHYFDFGRYHTPPQHGRIRDKETDPELNFKTIAKFCEKGEVLNHLEILEELSQNSASHGDGKIVSSIYKGISFEKAFQFAKKWQSDGAIPYGPFELNGTNCSRFVASLIKAGRPSLLTNLKLTLPKYSTASPIGNVKNVGGKRGITVFLKNVNKVSSQSAQRNEDRTLYQPVRPDSVDENAQWLSGEGAGSWFLLELKGEDYCISRFTPKGTLEFEKEFIASSKFHISKEYRFTHVSNAMKCILIQNGKLIDLEVKQTNYSRITPK